MNFNKRIISCTNSLGCSNLFCLHVCPSNLTRTNVNLMHQIDKYTFRISLQPSAVAPRIWRLGKMKFMLLLLLYLVVVCGRRMDDTTLLYETLTHQFARARQHTHIHTSITIKENCDVIYMRIWWVHIQNGAVYGVGFDAPAGCIIDAHRRLRQCNCVTFHALLMHCLRCGCI